MTAYYWCLTHDEVEAGATCKAANRLGPYETPRAARSWNQRHESRQETWEAEDERWNADQDDAAS